MIARGSLVTLPRPLAPRATVIARGSLVVLAGLAVLVRIASLADPTQAGEADHVVSVHALDRLGTDPGGASILALLQLGVYTTVTGAFGRHETGLAAVREPVVLAAVAVAVGIWWMARRMGLSRWTAGAAVGLTAVSPLAVTAQIGVRPENLAAMWAVAALVLLWTPHRHRRLAPDLWATLFLVVAVLTAPIALALVPTAAYLVWRRRRRRLSLMVGSLFALGVGLGWTSTDLSSASAPGLSEWLGLDPVLAAAGVFASVGALFSFRLRPLAMGVIALLAVAATSDQLGGSAAVLAVPFVALLLVGAVECGVMHRARVGRHALVYPHRKPTVALAATTAVATLVVWVF
ncbi:glycosyltransferase family 39 protein [Actinokineospora guangxiensis]|uniref:Glycosyltransferase family 39 protein n=1 Tax=Actinokineospora guangxiensis TaxID=1490288 RepID=A0ABW0ES76_9PSEU